METWPATHFTLAELTYSKTAEDHGLDNTPPAEIVHRLRYTAVQMDRIRLLLCYPIHIDSGYRCLALNRLLGSADTSAHPQGDAVDFTCDTFGPPVEIARAILARNLAFDQLIVEDGWVHIGFYIRDAEGNPLPQRRQVLHNVGGHYIEGLP